MASESVPSSVADFLSLAICGTEAMSRAFVLEVLVVAIKFTVSSISTFTGKLESNLP